MLFEPESSKQTDVGSLKFEPYKATVAQTTSAAPTILPAPESEVTSINVSKRKWGRNINPEPEKPAEKPAVTTPVKDETPPPAPTTTTTSAKPQPTTATAAAAQPKVKTQKEMEAAALFGGVDANAKLNVPARSGVSRQKFAKKEAQAPTDQMDLLGMDDQASPSPSQPSGVFNMLNTPPTSASAPMSAEMVKCRPQQHDGFTWSDVTVNPNNVLPSDRPTEAGSSRSLARDNVVGVSYLKHLAGNTVCMALIVSNLSTLPASHVTISLKAPELVVLSSPSYNRGAPCRSIDMSLPSLSSHTAYVMYFTVSRPSDDIASKRWNVVPLAIQMNGSVSYMTTVRYVSYGVLRIICQRFTRVLCAIQSV